MVKYVVTWDNGSGFREWASRPCPTQEEAIAAAGITQENLRHLDSQVETVGKKVRECNCGSGEPATLCSQDDQFCG